MKCFIPLAAILSVAVAGHSQVAVRLPFLNPAGVTYVNGPAPVGLAAGPAQYSYAPAAPAQLNYAAAAPAHLNYAAAAPAHLGYAAAAPYTHSVAYGAAPAYTHHAYHAAPIAHHVAQPIAHPLTRHLAQPLAPLTASVHHVPAVANVPVTHYEATPGVVQKVVDVAHPAVSTRKFHVRRPAIQKQFYDIEERVVVRPAGSALVELDEPLSKVQRGPSFISRAFHHHPLAALRVLPAVKALTPIHAIPTIPTTPVHYPIPSAPSAPSAPSGPSAPDASPVPTDLPTSSHAPPSQDSFNDDDSVSVGNPEFRSSLDQADKQDEEQMQDQEQQQEQQQQDQQQQDQEQQSQKNEEEQKSNEQTIASFESRQQSRPQFQFDSSRQFQSEREQFEARQFNFGSLAQQQQSQFQPEPIPDRQGQDSLQARMQDQSNVGHTEARFGGQDDQQREIETDGRSVFPSLRNLDSASSQANQQRFINLLTARDGVAEVGFGRSGPASGVSVDAGGVRARVLSATPAPAYAEPAGERVSTRRVVVSRPVETLQELDVVEPVTKLERVAVNTPTLFKTARLGVARVPTSFPVIQKTYAPAALPVFRKAYAHHPGLTYY